MKHKIYQNLNFWLSYLSGNPLLNSTFSFYLNVLVEFRLWLMQTSDALASCFPTVSPFLLLLRDPKTPRICSGVNRNDA